VLGEGFPWSGMLPWWRTHRCSGRSASAPTVPPTARSSGSGSTRLCPSRRTTPAAARPSAPPPRLTPSTTATARPRSFGDEARTARHAEPPSLPPRGSLAHARVATTPPRRSVDGSRLESARPARRRQRRWLGPLGRVGVPPAPSARLSEHRRRTRTDLVGAARRQPPSLMSPVEVGEHLRGDLAHTRRCRASGGCCARTPVRSRRRCSASGPCDEAQRSIRRTAARRSAPRPRRPFAHGWRPLRSSLIAAYVANLGKILEWHPPASCDGAGIAPGCGGRAGGDRTHDPGIMSPML
jgi:hypothetical protein